MLAPGSPLAGYLKSEHEGPQDNLVGLRCFPSSQRRSHAHPPREALGSVLGADAILSNVIERSRLVVRNDRQSSHTYTREALQEELGEKER